jgi:MFS family permease
VTATETPAGRLGDKYGYKQLFVGGLALFTVASVACGVAENSVELIVARLVQGLGAGIYYPAISAIIQRLYTGRDRSRAFGYLGGVVGISTAVGPLTGGLLIAVAGVSDGWRWVFLVNLFIGAVELPVAIKLLPRRQRREDHDLDLVENALLLTALLVLLFPLVTGRVSGWPPWAWALFGLFPAVTAALAWYEIRLFHNDGEPVIQVALMRQRSFAAGQALALLYFGGSPACFHPVDPVAGRARPLRAGDRAAGAAVRARVAADRVEQFPVLP